MKLERQDELVAKYPQIFQDIWGDMHVTCMAWGIAVGDGWYDLIDKLCADIMALDPGPDFKAAQVKEKFAGLRVYVKGLPEDEIKRKRIYELLDIAERDSFSICEGCGTRDDVTQNETGWIRSLCSSCRDQDRDCDDAEAVAESKRCDERRKEKAKTKE